MPRPVLAALEALRMLLVRLISLCLSLVALPAQPDERWVSFDGTHRPPDSSLVVSSADREGLTVDIHVSGVWQEERAAQGLTYHRLSLPSGGHTADPGLPEVPCYGRLLAVPHGAMVEARFVPLDSLELGGFTVWPAQAPVADDDHAPAFAKNDTWYQGTSPFPNRRLAVADVGTIRGCGAAMLMVFPIQYDPSRASLRVYTRARVEVRFIGGTGVFIDDRLRSRYFEPLLQRVLLNHRILGGFDALPRVREGEGDMLIIAADALYNTVTPLAEWRTSSGLPTVVVTRTTAGSTAQGIGQYIQDAYDQWEVPPSFVLLVGDSDLLPTNYRYMHPIQFNMTAADLWYFTVDGSDYFADMHYGRISVNNSSQLSQILAKLSSYEKTPQTGVWSNHVFLASYNEPGMYFTVTSDAIYSYLSSVGYDCDRAYEDGSPPGDTQDIIDNFNQGCFLVNHRDHGGRENWVHPSFWTYHFYQVNNGQMMPMVFSINCLSGYFDAETDQTQGTFESFSEELLRKSPGGAIAILSASRSSYSGYNDELNKGLIDAIWSGFDAGYPAVTQNPWPSPVYQPGAMLNFAKWYMYDKYVLTGGSGYPWPPTAEQTRLQMEMYHCHGDPSMDIHTAQPSAMVVSHQGSVVLGTTSFDVTVNTDGALAALSQNGQLLGRAFVAGGTAHIVLDTPPAQGTMTVVVTAHNRIPYQGAVSVVPANGWYVGLDSVATEDIWGYIDGTIDQGDSVTLAVTLGNIGTMAAPDVSARLLSVDGSVSIAVATQTFGTIPANGSATSPSPYRLHVHGGLSDGYIVPLGLEVVSGDSLWVHATTMTVHAPVLSLAQIVIDDSPGNGNGYAEPGETLDIQVRLRNNGMGTASSVDAVLSCDDPMVTIQTATTSYPDIGPGVIHTCGTPFQITLAPECPLGSLALGESVMAFGPFVVDLQLSIVVGAVPALVVDTDDESTEQRLLDAMDAVGYQYRIWRIPTQGPVPLDTMSVHRAVVWTGGDNNNSSATETDQETLAQYLSTGGSLLFSAENYLTTYGEASFTANFLHIEDFETGIDVNSVIGVGGDPITDGFNMTLDYPPDLSSTPDEITPDPETVTILNSQPFGRSVALRYPASGQGAYRVVVMAVPFEALPPGGPSPDNPETFLQRALVWLMTGADVTPPQTIDDLSIAPASGTSLALNWQPVWDDVAVHHYTVYRGTTAYFSPEAGGSLGTTSATSWIDPAGAGDLDVDHYYLVTASDNAGNESSPSNRVGERETPVEP